MKKLLALLLIFAMIFSMAACGVLEATKPEDTKPGNNGNEPSGGGSNVKPTGDDYNPRDPEQYIYRNVFANSPHKDKWETGPSGADLYGIWDQSVLPAVFPTQPEGVTDIDRTGFVGKLDEKWSSGSFGELVFDEDTTDYEYFYVMFEGTEATFEALKDALKANFICHDNAQSDVFSGARRGRFNAYSTDWYLYFSYTEGGDYDWETDTFTPSGEWSFTLNAIPAYYQLPKVVQGIALPQFGMIMWDEKILQCYDEGDEEYTYLDYDYQTGTADGTIKTYWANEEMRYYGATEAQFREYCQDIQAAGFTGGQDGGTNVRYKKDGVEVNIRYEAEYGYMYLWIVYGEYWYY